MPNVKLQKQLFIKHYIKCIYVVSTNSIFVSYYFGEQLFDPEIYNIREYEVKKASVTYSLALKFQSYGSSDLSVVSIHPDQENFSLLQVMTITK